MNADTIREIANAAYIANCLSYEKLHHYILNQAKEGNYRLSSNTIEKFLKVEKNEVEVPASRRSASLSIKISNETLNRLEQNKFRVKSSKDRVINNIQFHVLSNISWEPDSFEEVYDELTD